MKLKEINSFNRSTKFKVLTRNNAPNFSYLFCNNEKLVTFSLPILFIHYFIKFVEKYLRIFQKWTYREKKDKNMTENISV